MITCINIRKKMKAVHFSPGNACCCDGKKNYFLQSLTNHIHSFMRVADIVSMFVLILYIALSVSLLRNFVSIATFPNQKIVSESVLSISEHRELYQIMLLFSAIVNELGMLD